MASNQTTTVEDVVTFIRNEMHSINRVLTTEDPLSQNTVTDLLNRTNGLNENLRRIQTEVDINVFQRLSDSLASIKGSLESFDEKESPEKDKIGRLPNDSRRGNSRCNIDKGRLEYLLGLGFSVRKIASDGLLGGTVHYNTIHQFMKENAIVPQSKRFTPISDSDLEGYIKNISERFPNSGIREIKAYLQSEDPPIIVQRSRLENLVSNVDAVGTARRWAQAVSRRTYSVSSPNSLWHADTNHKLIRWNFVIDGCIDGFSRLIIYLRVHTDNCAATVLNDFFIGVKEYGLPCRTRSDGGSEFNHVETFLNLANGKISLIRGKSVHNQRIERLWRDVFVKVLEKYHKLFSFMEEKGVLDIDNDVQKSVLHHVFGPRIAADLDRWRSSHNNHAVRTEQNKTPLQLWHGGCLVNASNESSTAMNNIFRRDNQEVKDLMDQFLENHDLTEPSDIKIVLPRLSLPLTNAELERLTSTIDVHRDSTCQGLDIYGSVLNFVNECVSK